MPGTQDSGIFKSESRQGGITTTEAGSERQSQVGRFDDTCCGQSAEEPHEQTATKVDAQSVPGHVCGGNTPASADKITGQITQHATHKAATAYTKQCLEG